MYKIQIQSYHRVPLAYFENYETAKQCEKELKGKFLKLYYEKLS